MKKIILIGKVVIQDRKTVTKNVLTNDFANFQIVLSFKIAIIPIMNVQIKRSQSSKVSLKVNPPAEKGKKKTSITKC